LIVAFGPEEITHRQEEGLHEFGEEYRACCLVEPHVSL
jgi:hypothetical protein